MSEEEFASDNTRMVSLAGSIIGWAIFLWIITVVISNAIAPDAAVIIYAILTPFAIAYEIVRHT